MPGIINKTVTIDGVDYEVPAALLTDPSSGEAYSVGPARTGAAVTKSDDTELAATRALWVGGAGDLSVVFAGDETETAVTIAGVNAGQLLQVSVVKVMAATTATNIVALY